MTVAWTRVIGKEVVKNSMFLVKFKGKVNKTY